MYVCKEIVKIINPSRYVTINCNVFIYTTFIKRSIHKQTCSNALFHKYIKIVVSIVDIILLIIEVYYISPCVQISSF